MGNLSSSVGAFIFVFMVGLASVMVGVSLYHCFGNKQIDGLAGSEEAIGKLQVVICRQNIIKYNTLFSIIFISFSKILFA